MSTHTATIRAIDRDPTRRDSTPCRLVPLTLDAGTRTVHHLLSEAKRAQPGLLSKVLRRTRRAA